MNSFWKGLCHSILSLIALWIPTVITNNPYISVPLAGVIMWCLNWALSQTVATTSGASARAISR